MKTSGENFEVMEPEEYHSREVESKSSLARVVDDSTRVTGINHVERKMVVMLDEARRMQKRC